MKFRKFGKALLMGAVSVGTVLGVTSCVQSYTAGFLFVTVTPTAGNGDGQISGFKIDHNTGNLVPINGLPVSTAGAFPGRAILADASRFVYVLNRGVDAATSGPCTATTVTCNKAGISQFAVGGTGVLSFQQSYSSQGMNPFRIIGDAGLGVANGYLFVLDAVAPAGANCGNVGTNCGDITAFKIDPATGRLTLVVNAQLTSAGGSPIPYFPVPADPIDFAFTGQSIFTLSGTPASGDVVFPYAFSGGQLTISQNSAQPINARQATAITSANGNIYVLDNEPITIQSGGNFAAGTYLSQILPFTAGTGGALQAQTGGAVPDDPNLDVPIMLIGESKGSFVYVANYGSNTTSTVPKAGIVGYTVDKATHQLTPMSKSPFVNGAGTGSGPVCLLEDPSNQFIYTANFNDSTVTGRVLDPNSGALTDLSNKHGSTFKLDGPASWCLVSGRTS